MLKNGFEFFFELKFVLSGDRQTCIRRFVMYSWNWFINVKKSLKSKNLRMIMKTLGAPIEWGSHNKNLMKKEEK